MTRPSPEIVEYRRLCSQATHNATQRLRALHPEEYTALIAEERAALGVAAERTEVDRLRNLVRSLGGDPSHP